MNKLLALLCLLLALPVSLCAQRHFIPSRPRSDAALYEGPVLGLKGGVNMPRLSYTNDYLGSLPHDLMFTPSFGAFLEIPFLRPFTIAPELNFQTRGGSFSYKYMNVQENYQLKAHYVSVRIPVFFYMPISDRVKPYLFLSPDLGYATKGSISLSHPKHGLPDHSVPLNRSNMRYAYLGALGGAGIRFNFPLSVITIVMKLDAAINWGFLDTYAKLEQASTAIPVNVNSYHIDGKRFSRGLEVHLSLGFFINKYDACSVFQ